jgi:hypothetical protein
MKSYPESTAVLDDLGDKIVKALTRGVALAAHDLRKYRSTFPLWVADASERGLATIPPVPGPTPPTIEAPAVRDSQAKEEE